MHTLMQSLGTHKTRIMYTFTLVSFRDILVLFMCYLFEITFFLNMTEADAESYSPCQSHVIILYKTVLSLALSLTLESWLHCSKDQATCAEYLCGPDVAMRVSAKVTKWRKRHPQCDAVG